MLSIDQLKQSLSRTSKGRKLGAHQKTCPKCQRIIHADLPRCPSCAYAPWKWHPNVRFLLITLIISVVLLILLPLLTTSDKPYRVPVDGSSSP